MLQSPATRDGYLTSKRDDSGDTECGAGGEWSGVGVANPKAGKVRSEATSWREKIQPHEVVRPRGKERKHSKLMQNLLGYLAGHPGPCNGRGKGLEATKFWEEPFGRRGTCTKIISTAGPSVREGNKERNTSQLPKLLC